MMWFEVLDLARNEVSEIYSHTVQSYEPGCSLFPFGKGQLDCNQSQPVGTKYPAILSLNSSTIYSVT